jgi:hypothetical protein
VSLSAVAFRCPLDRLVASMPEIRATIAERLGSAALG